MLLETAANESLETRLRRVCLFCSGK